MEHMLNVVVTDPPRADPALVGELAGYGTATVHEAIGRRGYLGPRIRPIQPGAPSGPRADVLHAPR